VAVPRDLSIVGFGGLLISQTTWPRITTVHQPTISMARMAADALIAGFGKPVSEIGRVIEISNSRSGNRWRIFRPDVSLQRHQIVLK
jgi:LacI family transcriptional regulator